MATNRIISKLNRQIEAENELFNAMSKNEKKVQIAKDCIARIKAEQIKPDCGEVIFDAHLLQRQDESLQSILNNSKNLTTCQTCAKGSLFMSYIGRTNRFNSTQIKGYNNIDGIEHQKLLEIFSAKEIAYIEFAFEGKQYLDEDEDGNKIIFPKREITKVRKFYIKHGGKYEGNPINDSFDNRSFDNEMFDSEKRMIAICKNIIRNKGEFILR